MTTTVKAVKRKKPPKKMASFRMEAELVDEMRRIAKEAHAVETSLVEEWFRAGIEDYKKNGLKLR